MCFNVIKRCPYVAFDLCHTDEEEHEVYVCVDSGWGDYCSRTKTYGTELANEDDRVHETIVRFEVCHECAKNSRRGVREMAYHVTNNSNECIKFRFTQNVDMGENPYGRRYRLVARHKVMPAAASIDEMSNAIGYPLMVKCVKQMERSLAGGTIENPLYRNSTVTNMVPREMMDAFRHGSRRTLRNEYLIEEITMMVSTIESRARRGR